MSENAVNTKTYAYRSLLDFAARRTPGFASLVFAMLVSGQLEGFPFYGGVWFLTGQILLLCAEAFYKINQSLFSRRRRAAYAVAAALAAAVCVAATVFFVRGLKPRPALALLAFVLNQLAGMALLEGPALMPVARRGRLVVNLAVFSAVSSGALAVCAFVSRQEIPWLMVSYDALFLVLLGLKGALSGKGGAFFSGGLPSRVDGLDDIYAYRQYRRMAANALISTELTLMLLASYLLALPLSPGSSVLLYAARLLAIFGISLWACRLLLNMKSVKTLGSDFAFLVFSLLWIFISFYTVYHPEFLSGGMWVLPVALISLCMAALSAFLLNMDRYMVVIGEIGGAGVEKSRYDLFRSAAYHAGAVVSRLVLLALLASAAVYYALDTEEAFASLLANGNKLFVIPLLFLVPAALSALNQPLTKYYEQKLSRYSLQKLSGRVSRALERKLVLSLVKKNGKRIGIHLLRAAVKPFVTLRRVGVEKVDARQFPCVFVCNHAEVFGPVAATVNIPFFNRPWIIHEMVDAQKIAAHLQTGFDHAAWIPAPLRKRLGRALGPLLLWVMRSMDPIPVYRNNLKDIAKTIALSVEALESDDNILIFPENPSATDNRYVTDGVGEFFEGFVHIARNYCRATGRPLVFYSVYADSRARTISFSEGISFDAGAPFNEERDRVCAYLHGQMARMYIESRKENGV